MVQQQLRYSSVPLHSLVAVARSVWLGERSTTVHDIRRSTMIHYLQLFT